MSSLRKKTVFTFIVLFLTGVLLITLYQRKFPVIEIGKSFKISSFNSPKSSASLIRSDSLLLNMEFKIGENTGYEYAGAVILFDELTNLSKYDRVDLELHSEKSNDVSVTVTDFIEGFSSDDPLSEQYWMYELAVEKGKDHYSIPLGDFATPSWWFSTKGLKKEDIPENEGNMRKISRIIFSNHPNTKEKTPQFLQLKSVKIVKDFRAIWAVFSVIWGALFILTHLLQKIIFVPKSIINYKHVVVHKDDPSDDLKSVLSVINENYTDRQLNLNYIQNRTGFSETQIRKILKTEIGKGINHYINELRVTEACRLLHETDLQIKQIAHTVGYSHISSFNRAFNRITEENPQRFREKRNISLNQ